MKKLSKIIIYMTIALLFGFNDTAITISGIRFTLLPFLMIIFTLTLIFSYKKNLKEMIINESKRFSIFFMCFWLFWALISFIWVYDTFAWRIAINILVVGFFCAISFSLILENRKDILMAFRMMALASIIHNIIGWSEVITRNYFFLTTDNVWQANPEIWNGRPVSIFFNTNNFTPYLLASVFIFYITAVNSSKNYEKLFFYLCMASSSILIVLSQSRISLLGLIISLLAFICLTNMSRIRKLKDYLMKGKQKWLIAVSVLLVLILYFFLNDLFFTGENVVADVARLRLIQNGFRFLVSTFGRGVGAGNISYWMMNYGVFDGYYVYQIHNWFMDILVAYGIIIFMLYITFYCGLIKNNINKLLKVNGKINRSLPIANLCVLISFPIISIAPGTLMLHIWHWVLFGVFIAYQKLPRDET